MTVELADVRPPAHTRAAIAELADNFVGLVRSFNKARSRMLAQAAHDVEWSSHVALRILKTEGPMRAGLLAECLQSDPSTVSRQVAAMVKDGLLERRADPGDGRASLLVLTPKADAVLADHNEIRINHFADMLDAWSASDVAQFADLLRRFTEAYEQANATWMTERTERQVPGIATATTPTVTTPTVTTPSDTTPSDTTPSDTTPSDTTPSDTAPSVTAGSTA